MWGCVWARMSRYFFRFRGKYEYSCYVSLSGSSLFYFELISISTCEDSLPEIKPAVHGIVFGKYLPSYMQQSSVFFSEESTELEFRVPPPEEGTASA